MSGCGSKPGMCTCGEQKEEKKCNIPDTIEFQCPGGKCGCGKTPPKRDRNNNSSMCCDQPKKDDDCPSPAPEQEECPPPKKEECAPPKQDECPPPPPPTPAIRPMPKVECQCPTPAPKEATADKCAKKYLEDDPPPICTKLPETKTFKCIGDDCLSKEDECKKGGDSNANSAKKKDDCASPSSCKSCGSPVPQACPCQCGGKQLVPPPKLPCGCRGNQGPCGPNTSCDVQPLTMKKKR